MACAAFDGPLRSDLRPIGVYRVAERMLTRGFQRLIGKPGQSSAPVGKQLNFHANECAKVVLGLGKISLATHRTAIHAKAIVEAFPSSFLGLMIAGPQLFDAQRGNRSDIFYVHLATTGVLTRLISDLLPNRRLVDIFEAVTNHDDRAAVVCARLRLFASPPADTVQLAIGRGGSFYHRGIIFNLGLGRFSSKTQKPRMSLYVRTHSARDAENLRRNP